MKADKSNDHQEGVEQYTKATTEVQKLLNCLYKVKQINFQIIKSLKLHYSKM